MFSQTTEYALRVMVYLASLDGRTPTIAQIGRNLGLDITSAVELRRLGVSDEDHLEFATREGRCLVTRDRDDFIGLTKRFFDEQRTHAGVLLVPRSMPGGQFHRIARAIKAYADRRGDRPSDFLFDYLR